MKSIMVGKLAMKPFAGSPHSHSRGGYVCKVFGKDLPPTYTYVGSPDLSFWAPAHAFHSRFIEGAFAPIEEIKGLARKTEIRDRVIGRVPIYMVNTCRRNLTRLVEPCQPVSPDKLIENADNDITIRCQTSCGVPFSTVSAAMFSVSENTSYWIVFKKPHQVFVSKGQFFHRSKAKGQQREVRNRYWPFLGLLPRAFSLSLTSRRSNNYPIVNFSTSKI